ncbi:MAG TPA: diaminopimelate decarboxylase [Candidatus Limnocylindrales bacterium]
MIDRLAPALREAARRFGTPLYATDLVTLAESAAAVRSAFPDPIVRAFSLKANDVAAIAREVGLLGFDANVVSAGEWAIARRAGFPNARITFEGVGKTDAELAAAVRAADRGQPLRWLAIESLDELEALRSILRRATPAGGRSVDVLFRLNPDVVPETIAALAVGAPASKFGLTADELTEAVSIAADTPGLAPRGVHLHVGSQLRAVDAWRDAVRRGLALVALLGGSLPRFDTLDLGGGFPVLPEADAALGPAPERFARELQPLLDALPEDRRPARLAIEPGRALVARAGVLVGRVLHVRERGGRQVVLDTGMTELIRPALYGARHDIVALTSLGRAYESAPGSQHDPRLDPALEPARVEGPICESTDHLGEHALPALRRGDLVAILDAGAYGASLASAYNGRPRPPQVFIEADGSLRLARRRGARAALG